MAVSERKNVLVLTRPVKQYGLAIAAVTVALLLMLALDPFLYLSQATFLLFFGAVTIAALYGGRNAGIIATLLSALAAQYFFLSPQYAWSISLAGTFRIIIFIAQGVLISVLIGSLRTTQAQVRRNLAQLNASETEIRELNQALRRRVNELQTLFDVIPINIVVAEDPDCQTVRINPGYAQTLQIPKDANVSLQSPSGPSASTYRFYQNGQELTGDDLPVEYAAKHGVAVHDIEVDLVKPDHTVVNLYGHTVPLFDEAGRPRGSIGVFTDITERKRTELALRESEEQLKAAIERFEFAAKAVNCLIYDWQLDSDRVERTDGLTKLFGYSLDEAEPTGQWWSNLVHPDDLPLLNEQAQSALTTSDTFSAEYRVLNKANEHVYVLDQCIVVARDATGQPTRIIGSTTDISDRKRAEAELQRRELEFRTLLENTPDIITRYDRDLRHLYISHTIEQAVGIPADSIVGYTADQLGLTSPAMEEWYATVQRVFDTGQSCLIETAFPRPDGELRLYQAHFVPELREGETVKTVVSFSRDVTEYKRVEASLRQNEERLRLAMKAAHMGTWDVDLITGEAIWSDQHFILLGYDADADGKASEAMWMERIHPDDRDRVLQAWQESRLNHQLYRTDYRVIRADNGQIAWLTALGSFDYDATGQAVRSLGVVFDITQRKQAEVSFLKLNQQLQDKVTELQTLLDVIPIGIGIAEDRECRYIRANPAFAKLLNLPNDANTSLSAPEAEQPRTFKVFQNGQEMATDDLPLQYAAKYGQEVHELEVEIVRQDGVVITLLEYAAPLLDETGEPRGSIGAFLDISDRKQAEAEREQLLQREQAARAEAERANRVKDEFLAILSHELRSPLNPILGWSRLLQTKRFDEERTQQALATIERNAKLQTQLIDDLLDIARILRGKLKLNEATVNLATAIEAALEVVKTAAQAKAIALNFELTDICQVRGDEGRLQQIVWNLLSNAIKFTPDGGRVEVRLECVKPESTAPASGAYSTTQAIAQITVTDTGKGIRPDFLPHLFQSFRQEDVSTTRQHGGLGLGLSIVKYLVDAHGGTITADSRGEGQGASFTVQLPLLQSESLPAEAGAATDATTNLAGIKVLAVDDSEDTRMLLETVLMQYGADVSVVDSGAAALNCLSQVKPHVLVCDIGMPQMDGYTLLRQIRQLTPEQGCDVPAIAVTAFAREEDRQQAFANGFQAHMAKPILPERLAIAILKLVRPSPD